MLRAPAASKVAAVPAKASETASVAMVTLLEVPAVVQALHDKGCVAPVAPYSQYTFMPALGGWESLAIRTSFACGKTHICRQRIVGRSYAALAL